MITRSRVDSIHFCFAKTLTTNGLIKPQNFLWLAIATSPLMVSDCAAIVSNHMSGLLTKQQRAQIGRKIWQNECGGTIEGLTCWNKGESFASLGVGHFIWCSRKNSCPFSQTFPSFIRYLDKHGVAHPRWLTAQTSCPWKNRKEFRAALQSKKMQEVRQLLIDTIDLQISFLIERLEKALPRMLQATSKRAHTKEQFVRLAKTSRGLYALIDYVNFKGEGLPPSTDWGLLQVIEQMHGSDPKTAPRDFANTAQRLLAKRANARGEEHWLAGWQKRVNSYVS